MIMADTFSEHLLGLGRREVAGVLARLCDAVEADESSLLVPGAPGLLAFFASTNPRLAGSAAPPVPIQSSFTGLAFVTGQAIALADAAGQPGHFKAVDALVDRPTREFAAIPLLDRRGAAVGVLTLANRRPAPSPRAGEPFAPADLAEGERTARDLAAAVGLLQGLGAEPDRGAEAEPDLVQGIAALGPRDRRVLRALLATLAAEGGPDDDVA